MTEPNAERRTPNAERRTPNAERALMLCALGIHGRSRRGDIHNGIGAEILERTVRRELAAMVQAGLLTPLGEAGGRRHELTAGR